MSHRACARGESFPTLLPALPPRRGGPLKLWLGSWLPLVLGFACTYDYAGLQTPWHDGGPPPSDGGGAGGGGLSPDGGGRGGRMGDPLIRGMTGGIMGNDAAGGGPAAAGGGTAGGSAGGGGVPTGGAGGRSSAGGQTGGTATGGAGQGGAGGRVVDGGGGAGAPSVDLVLRYGFDDGDGVVARDSAQSGTGARQARLEDFGTGGGSGFSTDRRTGTHSLALQSNRTNGGGFVETPPIGTLAREAITIALWVKMTSTPLWQRIFDYGFGADRYFFLTAGDAASFVRFGITATGWVNEEQIISTVRLVPGTWHHVAVVLGPGRPYRGTLYVDGVAAGVNTAMILRPGDLGETTNNYLGRSQFDYDPFFNGLLDDYRVYRRELTSVEILNLFTAR